MGEQPLGMGDLVSEGSAVIHVQPLPHSDAGKHDYDREPRDVAAAHDFSTRQARAAYLDMPPLLRQARYEYVLRLLRREKAQKRNQHSALWKQAGPVFDINVEDL